jgi:hypothetical protein
MIGRYMDILDQKTDSELLRSLLAEVAKTTSEIKCAKQDLDKATSRLSFVLVLANTLINRKED